jgi:hypothetical protein
MPIPLEKAYRVIGRHRQRAKLEGLIRPLIVELRHDCKATENRL